MNLRLIPPRAAPQRLKLWLLAPSRPVRQILLGVITTLARGRHARAAALLARFFLHTVRPPTHREDARQVLLLPKAGFVDDALVALETVADVEVVALPRTVIMALARAYLPPEVDDNNYYSASPAAQAAMARYRAFLVPFWRAFDPAVRIGAVLTANFGYYAERELGAALESINVPFIVIHKENTKGPGGRAFWERVYRERRGPFLGRLILVYNPVERDIMVSTGVVSAERIEVIGMPRLDAVHRWRERHAGQPSGSSVFFASFLPDINAPTLIRKHDAHGRKYREAPNGQPVPVMLTELCRSVHQAVVDLAASCPDIPVILKTKGRSADRSQVLAQLGVAHERDLPSNLRIVHGGSPVPLLCNAAVTCAFNTTIILEALAAGCTVVIPWYAEVLDESVAKYVFDVGPAVERVHSQRDLVARLKDLARERRAVPATLDAPTGELLYNWLGNDDGQAGARAARVIRRELDARALSQVHTRH